MWSSSCIGYTYDWRLSVNLRCDLSGVSWCFMVMADLSILWMWLYRITYTMDLLVDLEHYELSMRCEVSGVRWRFMAVIVPIYILRWIFCRRIYNGNGWFINFMAVIVPIYLLILTATCTMDLLIDLEHYELSMDCEVSGVRWRFMAVIVPIYLYLLQHVRWTYL